MYSKNPNEESDFISGFRENANQGEWEQRLTDSYGLILSLDGEGVISIGSGTLTLGPGSLVLLKPVLKHTFRIRNSWSYLWFHFLPRPHISRELEWPELIPGVGMTVLSPAELETVRKELEEAHKLEYQRPNGWRLRICWRRVPSCAVIAGSQASCWTPIPVSGLRRGC